MDTYVLVQLFGNKIGDKIRSNNQEEALQKWLLAPVYTPCRVFKPRYNEKLNRGLTLKLDPFCGAGHPVSCMHNGYLRRFYMSYTSPGEPIPDISTSDGGVRILDPAKIEASMSRLETSDPFMIDGEIPLQHDHVIYRNDPENRFVGMWDSTAFKSEMSPFPWYEFIQILEGEVVITEDDGTAQVFTAGEAFFIPMETVCPWHTSGYLKLFYSILKPGLPAV